MKKILIIIVAAVILSGCTFLKTPEIKGVVVDAETGKPIDGVNIYAEWYRVTAGPGGQTRGATLKELRIKTKAGGAFEIPGYLLVNIVPFPFGQGGEFHIVVYAHGYQNIDYHFGEYRDFRTIRYNEFKSGFGQTVISLSKLTDPEKYYFQIDARFGDDYLLGDYQYFLEHFPESRWRNDVERQLNSMKKQ